MDGAARCDHCDLPGPIRADPARRAEAVLRPSWFAVTAQPRPDPNGPRIGDDRLTVTPRRARCVDCGAAQILLPTALTVRRADTPEVIGNAGREGEPGRPPDHCSRTGPAGLDSSAVAAPAGGDHPEWQHHRAVHRAVEHAAQVDRDLLVPPAPQRTPLGHALNLRIGTAVRYRQVLGPLYPLTIDPRRGVAAITPRTASSTR